MAAFLVVAPFTLIRTTRPSPVDGIALQQRAGGARVFVDSAGRERIFRGTNAVVKGPPWHPDTESFSTDVSMAEEDFKWMRKMGLNLLRLGVMWPGVEPIQGEYNESYLDQIDTIVTRAADYGVHTLLDMHQVLHPRISLESFVPNAA